MVKPKTPTPVPSSKNGKTPGSTVSEKLDGKSKISKSKKSSTKGNIVGPSQHSFVPSKKSGVQFINNVIQDSSESSTPQLRQEDLDKLEDHLLQKIAGLDTKYKHRFTHFKDSLLKLSLNIKGIELWKSKHLRDHLKVKKRANFLYREWCKNEADFIESVIRSSSRDSDERELQEKLLQSPSKKELEFQKKFPSLKNLQQNATNDSKKISVTVNEFLDKMNEYQR